MKNYGLMRRATSTAVLEQIPIPAIRPDYILVETKIIALQPTDWTSLDAVGKDGVLNGCDFAGVVVEVGPGVTRFVKGDRVAGFAHGANDADPELGAFARYILAKGEIQMHIPDGVSFEEAVAAASSVPTTGLALYHFLKLPLPESPPSDPPETILIYGASTAIGSVAIQFAKLSGHTVVTLCSPKHFKMVHERGIEAVYDYRLPNIGEQINEDTDGKITKVLDTVAVESSAAICATAMSNSSGGHYVNLLGIDSPRSDVKSEFFLAYGVSGERYVFEGEEYPAELGYFAFMKEFTVLAEILWAEGKFKTHPVRVREDGLLGAVEGMQEMREGRAPSGEKWVYRVEKTEWPSAV